MTQAARLMVEIWNAPTPRCATCAHWERMGDLTIARCVWMQTLTDHDDGCEHHQTVDSLFPTKTGG